MSVAMPKERILFVDDETQVLSAFERERGDQYDIATVNNGFEVLDRIATGERFTLVISDEKMPGMSGIEMLSRIEELAPDNQNTAHRYR